MNSDNGSPITLTRDDELRLGRAADSLRGHTDRRWVEVANDVLSRVLASSWPSHPLRAQSLLGDFHVSEQVLTKSLQQALDIVPHCEVTHIFIKAVRDRYAGVTIVIAAEYPYPLIPIADRIRGIVEQRLQQILGQISPDVDVSAMHVHVEDVTKGDPKLG